MKNCEEPISQIQIVGHSTDTWSIVFKKVSVLKDQIKGQGALAD